MGNPAPARQEAPLGSLCLGAGTPLALVRAHWRTHVQQLSPRGRRSLRLPSRCPYRPRASPGAERASRRCRHHRRLDRIRRRVQNRRAPSWNRDRPWHGWNARSHDPYSVIGSPLPDRITRHAPTATNFSCSSSRISSRAAHASVRSPADSDPKRPGTPGHFGSVMPGGPLGVKARRAASKASAVDRWSHSDPVRTHRTADLPDGVPHRFRPQAKYRLDDRRAVSLPPRNYPTSQTLPVAALAQLAAARPAADCGWGSAGAGEVAGRPWRRPGSLPER